MIACSLIYIHFRPVEGEDVIIPGQAFVIIDEALPSLGVITVGPWATLQLQDGMDHVIDCTHLFLAGGQLVTGFDDYEFQSKVTINLQGDLTSYDLPLGSGTVMGAKAIGVFGGLILQGKDKGPNWVKLASTALAGTNSLVVNQEIGWEVGDEIVLTTSSFVASEAEKLTIAAISADKFTITTVENLMHNHDVWSGDFNGETVTTAPEVGLLTQNIVIHGADSDDRDEEEFGCRVLIGQFVDGNNNHLQGFAQLSNVAFTNCGQRAFVENYDPRFSLAFLNAFPSTAGNKYESFVKKCSFNHNYNTAIGAFGSTGITFEVSSSTLIWKP